MSPYIFFEVELDHSLPFQKTAPLRRARMLPPRRGERGLVTQALLHAQCSLCSVVNSRWFLALFLNTPYPLIVTEMDHFPIMLLPWLCLPSSHCGESGEGGTILAPLCLFPSIVSLTSLSLLKKFPSLLYHLPSTWPPLSFFSTPFPWYQSLVFPSPTNHHVNSSQILTSGFLSLSTL